MQTVEIQCGSCNQIMGVGVENLGAQVHCPHCQAVVQVPDANAFGITSPAPELALPKLNLREDDSIFSSRPPHDDPFDDPPSSAPAPSPAAAAAATFPDEEDIPAPTIGRRPEEKNIAPLLFMILIPYCLLTTGLLIWLFLNQQGKPRFDPMERLPDPKPSEAPRAARHAPVHYV